MAYFDNIKQLIGLLSGQDGLLSSSELTELQAFLQKLHSEKSDCRSIFKLMLKIIFAKAGQNKRVRKCIKTAIHKITKQSPGQFEECLSEHLRMIFSTDAPAIVPHALSFFLEDCQCSHKLLSPYFSLLVRIIACNFQRIVTEEVDYNPEGRDQPDQYEVVKLALQIIQFMKDEVNKCIVNDGSEFQDLSSVADGCLHILLKQGVYSGALCNMCSVFLGQFINYCSDDEQAALTMYQLLGEGDKLRLEYRRQDGFLHIDVQKETLSDNCKMVMLKGLFSCMRDMPFMVEMGNDVCPTFLHCTLKEICKALQFLGESEYLVFQVLKLWWVRVVSLSKTLCKEVLDKYFSNECYFMKTNLKILMKHWDDPISGVSDIILQIFTMVVKLSLFINNKTEANPAELTTFLKTLFHDLIRLSPSVKGKYNFITVLVSQVGTNFLLEQYPGFLDSLLPLLSVNHLCPVVSKTYKAVVCSLMKNTEHSDKKDAWRRVLAPGLIKALLRSGPVIRVNGLRYWLPVHLKNVPDAYCMLVETIEMQAENGLCHSSQKGSKLLAQIAVTKVARSENLISVKDVGTELLHAALSNFDNDVRAEAFSLVCCDNKSSNMISCLEMDLVKIYLPLNMNCDSAIFRNNLILCIRTFMERIVNSAIAFEREKHKAAKQVVVGGKDYKDLCSDLIDFIMDLCMRSLHVTFTYQRKKTAIDIFTALLAVLFSPMRTNSPFFKMSELKEDILSLEHSRVLFGLLQDAIPEIRECSLRLLVDYFPPLQGVCWEEAEEFCFASCRSPRSQDSESAAVVFEYLMIAEDLQNGVSEKRNEDHSKESKNLSVLKHLIALLTKMEEDYEQFKHNIHVAAKKAPVHGWMLVINRYLQNILKTNKFCSDAGINAVDLLEIIFRIEQCTESVIQFTLTHIFGCEGDRGGGAKTVETSDKPLASADFCEITRRIEKLTMGDAEKKGCQIVLLTTDHEAVLACCWLCLLRGSSLLSTITAVLVRDLREEEPRHESVLKNICKIFVAILTGCRHRGALEGTYDSFLVTCKSLMSSNSCSYKVIPSNILLKILNILSRGESGSNITRRSAGIPMVLEAILVAEKGQGNDALFKKTVAEMIDLSKRASNLRSNICGDNYDLNEVHGIYVLKHLLKNTQLGSAVLRYTEDIFQISYHCLSSPLWVVRNAATHLYGAVSSRMLGQKNIDGVHIELLDNSIPSGEFFSYFPKLGDFMVSEIKSSAMETPPDIGCNIRQVSYPKLPKAGLHPVLSVLSKLTFGKHCQDNVPKELVPIIVKLLGSPVYAVRCLAAESLLGLEAEEALLQRAFTFVNELPLNYQAIDMNLLHGELVFVHLLLRKYSVHSYLSGTKSDLLKKLLERFWLMDIESNVHSMTGTLYLQIVSDFTKMSVEYSSLVLHSLKMEITGFLGCKSYFGSLLHKPGIDLYLHTFTDLMLSLANDDDVAKLFNSCISCRIPTIQLSTLAWAKKAAKVTEEVYGIVVESLLGSQNNGNTMRKDVLCECIEMLAAAANQQTKLKHHKKLYELLCGILESEESSLSLKCSAIKLLSAVAVDNLSQISDKKDDDEVKFALQIIVLWSHCVCSRTSSAEASEPLRMSSAVSLEMAGRPILLYLLQRQEISLRHEGVDDIASKSIGNVVKASISLLHDEQPDIREHACVFVSKLCSEETSSYETNILHQNAATQKFLRLILSKSLHNRYVLDVVLRRRWGSVASQNDSNQNKALLFDKEPFNLYEEPIEIVTMATNNFLVVLQACDDKRAFKNFLLEFLQDAKVQVGHVMLNMTTGAGNYVESVCALTTLKAILMALDAIDGRFPNGRELKDHLQRLLKNCPDSRMKSCIKAIWELL